MGRLREDPSTMKGFACADTPPTSLVRFRTCCQASGISRYIGASEVNEAIRSSASVMAENWHPSFRFLLIYPIHCPVCLFSYHLSKSPRTWHLPHRPTSETTGVHSIFPAGNHHWDRSFRTLALDSYLALPHMPARHMVPH